jgi:hypothetical protein
MAVIAVGLGDAERDRLIALAVDRSRSVVDLADALPDAEDEEELYRVIAALWLQLRFEWQRHNDVLNYAAVGETPKPELAAEGCMGSLMLERLEGVLFPTHLDTLSGYAFGLLAAVGTRVPVSP